MTWICDPTLSQQLGAIAGKLAGSGIISRAREAASLSLAQRPAWAGRDLLIRGSARPAREAELIQLAHVIGIAGEAPFFAHLLQQGIGPRGEVLILDEENTGPLAETFAEFRIAAAEFVDVRVDGIPGIVCLAGQETVHRMAERDKAGRSGKIQQRQ